MNQREINIIEAAVRVFLRYGVKKTGMNDIAEEAGVARQTLYNVYANKEKVLQATIRLSTERTIDAIESGLAEGQTFAEKLEIIFQNIAVVPFEYVDGSPHAADLMDGFNATSLEEIKAKHVQQVALIARILKAYESAIISAGLNCNDLADFIQTSANAIKKNATSRKHLDVLLINLKTLLLRTLEG